MEIQPSLRPLLIAGLAILCPCQSVIAQSTGNQVDGNRIPQNAPVQDKSDLADGESEIKLGQISQPPLAIQALIKKGAVRLVYGGERSPTSNTLPIGSRMVGETRYTFRYQYDSHAKWVVESRRPGESSSQLMVRLRVRFRSIKLLTSHEVWLRERPANDSFWENKVVLHELDHVRISADPRIESQFREAVKKLESMRVPFSELRGPSGTVDNSKVQAFIESRMKQTLEDTTDLVKIRYQELDRLTQHGLRPIPPEADLFEKQ